MTIANMTISGYFAAYAALNWGLPFLLPEGLQCYRIVIYGVLLIAILLVKPEGLITRPLIRRVTALVGRRPPGGRSAGAATERSG